MHQNFLGPNSLIPPNLTTAGFQKDVAVHPVWLYLLLCALVVSCSLFPLTCCHGFQPCRLCEPIQYSLGDNPHCPPPALPLPTITTHTMSPDHMLKMVPNRTVVQVFHGDQNKDMLWSHYQRNGAWAWGRESGGTWERPGEAETCYGGM